MYNVLVLSTEKTKILVLFPEIDPTFASGTQFDSTVNWNKNGIRTQGALDGIGVALKVKAIQSNEDVPLTASQRWWGITIVPSTGHDASKLQYD